MIKSKLTSKTTRIEYKITTDDIEEILKEKLNLTGDIKFYWHLGQWVDLTIKQTITTTEPDNE